jgi:hypothetical protein
MAGGKVIAWIPPLASPSGGVTSVSIGYSHMTRTSAYGYTLEEKDGKALFSCRYFTSGGEEVSLERVPVEPRHMDELRAIIERHGLLNMKHREPDWRERMVSDAPVYSLTLRSAKAANGRTPPPPLRLNYFPPGAEEVKAFFLGLAQACAEGG